MNGQFCPPVAANLRIPIVMTDPFRAENHFLPRLYLRGFENPGRKVAVYRTLVSHPKVPEWETMSTKGLGRMSHLYSVKKNGMISDELERWLETEYETPAAPVLSKALADKRLSQSEWDMLIRFAAAQDLRTPRRLAEMLQRIRHWMPTHF